MQIETIQSDYVVVGGGSGGAVVAARLSENPDNQVLLLEAGPEDNDRWIDIPIGFAKLLANPKLMWHLETTPEPNLHNRRISALRGKVLGGSSTVNGLIYVRGTPSDYAIWAQLGAAGWGYDDVLPFFHKAERQQHGGDQFHGADGPLGVEDARWVNPLAEAFLASAETVGMKRRTDFCQRDIAGAGYYQMTTWKGRRVSTARAYIKPARHRGNLRVLTEALALKVEFEGTEARSVLFEQGGRIVRAHARREIILAAGSFGTPHLLQLSGVGDGELLASHGIAPVHHLRGVGENLMDHLLPKRGYTTTSRDTLNAMMSGVVSKGMAGIRYALTHTGPLAVGAALAGGYVCSRPGLEDPDLQLFFMPFEAGDYSGKLPATSSFQLSFYQNRPESRGHVRLGSPDPHDPPQISMPYLDTEADRRAVVDGLRLIGKIGDAAPLRAFNAVQMESTAGLTRDEDLLEYAKQTASSGYHHVGTCRIGQNDAAVVDPQLRVHGLSRLRIADGSVMPALPSGNTNSVCIMIGEKCADMIARAA